MNKALVGVAIVLAFLSIGFLAAGITQHLWKEMAIILGVAAGTIALGGTLTLAGVMFSNSLNDRLSHATTSK